MPRDVGWNHRCPTPCDNVFDMAVSASTYARQFEVPMVAAGLHWRYPIGVDKQDSVDVAIEKANEYRGLAELIALEYTNIPRANLSEAVSEAYHALVRASAAFDPIKGDFASFAARAIRNALNSLYAKQLRLARVFPRSLDEPPDWQSASEVLGDDNGRAAWAHDPSQDVRKEIRRRETVGVLSEVLLGLPPRQQLVLEGIRKGLSLAEIGRALGVSRQTVHKSAIAGLTEVRRRLESLGYRGVDSQGLLKTSVAIVRRGAG